MITFILGTIAGFIGGVLFGRRNVRIVEAALLDAKAIGKELVQEAELKTKKLQEELDKVREEKAPAPRKKKDKQS